MAVIGYLTSDENGAVVSRHLVSRHRHQSDTRLRNYASVLADFAEQYYSLVHPTDVSLGSDVLHRARLELGDVQSSASVTGTTPMIVQLLRVSEIDDGHGTRAISALVGDSKHKMEATFWIEHHARLRSDDAWYMIIRIDKYSIHNEYVIISTSKVAQLFLLTYLQYHVLVFAFSNHWYLLLQSNE